jgi:hypothetical protein
MGQIGDGIKKLSISLNRVVLAATARNAVRQTIGFGEW